ncbi:hypothetical protein CBL_08825 [Carabus blaptoides fortunei]
MVDIVGTDDNVKVKINLIFGRLPSSGEKNSMMILAWFEKLAITSYLRHYTAYESHTTAWLRHRVYLTNNVTLAEFRRSDVNIWKAETLVWMSRIRLFSFVVDRSTPCYGNTMPGIFFVVFF